MKLTSRLLPRLPNPRDLFKLIMAWLCVITAGLPHQSLAEIKADEDLKKENKQKSPAPTKPSARLYLNNGDKLSGLPLSVDNKQNLLFDSDSLRQTAAFPLANVLSITLDGWKERDKPVTIAKIRLQQRFGETSGDTILGELKELTPDSIKLDTWYGGEITLKRSMVDTINIISNTPGSYYGPNSIHEWTLSGDPTSWSFRSGTLTSLEAGGIGKDVGLREKSHLSFDAHWRNSMRFKFHLYSSDVGTTNPEACYEVSINRSYAYMTTKGKAAKAAARLGGGGRWQRIASKPEGDTARFDIFTDRKAGMVTIYINGLRACMVQSQTPDPEDLGTGLTFLAEDQNQLDISDIAVKPWNGKSLPRPKNNNAPQAPQKDERKKSDGEDKKETPPHRIILNNGDEVPGTVGKVDEEGRLLVETAYTPIRIPIKRIKSVITLGNTGEQPKMYREDVRAWFHRGGFVTLKLASFKDGKLTGYSQAMGNVSLDLSAFGRIDFQIYDHKANQTRNAFRF